LTITALSMQTTPKPLSQASLQSVITASAKLSSVLALSISSYPIPSRPSNTAKGVFQTTISAEAASKIADFTSTEDPQPVESHKVVPVVVGILLGVILLVVPFVLFMYRRRQRVQHRRSIGGIEKDTFARPWEKSEMKLRRKTANMESLYPAEKRPRELLMPEPIFAPLRPNRSSSLYTGSILNSLEHLSSDIEQPKAWYPGRTDIGNNQNGNYVLARQASRPYSNPEFSETQPIQRNSGYEYYDDPFRTPLYSPASIITKVWHVRSNPADPFQISIDLPDFGPSRPYRVKIRPGMGVQKTVQRSKSNPEDSSRTEMFSPQMPLRPYNSRVRPGMGVQRRFSASTTYPTEDNMIWNVIRELVLFVTLPFSDWSFGIVYRLRALR
jgi:hypothetical protein